MATMTKIFKVVVFLLLSLLSVGRSAKLYRNTRDNSNTATILQQDYINEGNSYNFAYQTSDGVAREENAELKNPGQKDESLVVRGSFSYVATDGNTYTVNYIADENGYRPTGEHLPSI